MPGRQYSAETVYRYGFNGKELDPEGMGGGLTTYDYGFRIYNPAIAKFLSVDPLAASYPMLTTYQFASNGPIHNIDLYGLEAKPAEPVKPGSLLLKTATDNLANPAPQELKLAVKLPPPLPIPDKHTIDLSYQDKENNRKATAIGEGLGIDVLHTLATGKNEKGEDVGRGEAAIMAAIDWLPLGKFLPSSVQKRGIELLKKAVGGVNSSRKSPFLKGSYADAANEFAEMTKGAVEIREISKDGKSIGKFAIMPDGTNVTLRNFSASESNANAVIEIVNQDSKNAKETYRFEFKFFDEDKIPTN